MRTITLGSMEKRRELLRDGAFEVKSRRGLVPAAALLIEELPARAPRSVLLAQDASGALLPVARWLWPEARIVAYQVDAWVAGRLEREARANGLQDARVLVAPDLPDAPAGGFDLCCLPLSSSGDALFTRELVEEAHDRLAPGGRLLASTDGSPHWLKKLAAGVFGRADFQRVERRGGAVVSARRTKEVARAKGREHAVRFERAGRELVFHTRPGVFLHGRIDAGTKALLSAFEAPPGARVLDLGCGVGVLGIAAAAEAGDAGCVLVDSNARAADLARRNARENALERAAICRRADLEGLPAGPYDLVLANPPYFSNGRIARSFVRAAAALAPRGRLLMVARNVPLHRAIVAETYAGVRVREVGGYGIFEGVS